MTRVVVVAQGGGGIARSLRGERRLLMPAGVDLEGAHAVGERVDAQAHLALRHVSGGMVSGRAERGDPYGWVLGSGVQEHGDRLVQQTNKRANTQEDTDLDLLLLHMGDQDLSTTCHDGIFAWECCCGKGTFSLHSFPPHSSPLFFSAQYCLFAVYLPGEKLSPPQPGVELETDSGNHSCR